MLHKARPEQFLYIHSMGKKLRITAIATTPEEANAHMERHHDDAVIAELGPFVFMANKYDKGQPA